MLTSHQLKQQGIVDAIVQQISTNSLRFSTVSPVEDYLHDSRTCLTSVHLPHKDFLENINTQIVEPLRKVEPSLYYYPTNCLHMTIKTVRVVNNPPHFSEEDVHTALRVFDEIVPQHSKFNVYFYRLLLFPNNLALIGTTDEELDHIILDLDERLTTENIPDDNKYINTKYFFCNMTLARFNETPSKSFTQKVQELSNSLKFAPYQIDSVTLLTCNAVLENKRTLGTWKLQ